MYKRILVSIDGSATSNRGLDEAVMLAVAGDADLRLIHIVDPIPFTVGYETFSRNASQDNKSVENEGQKLLDVGKQRAMAAGAKNVETVLVERGADRISERIVEQAKAWDAHLIVIGTHGRRGVGRLLLGSDAEQTMRIAPVPILLVRTPDDAAAA